MMNIFNKKKHLDFYGRCFFCNTDLDKDYCSLSFEAENGEINEYGRICKSCADKLEEIEKKWDTMETIDLEEEIDD